MCLLFTTLFFNNMVRANSLGNVLQGMEEPLSFPNNQNVKNNSDLKSIPSLTPHSVKKEGSGIAKNFSGKNLKTSPCHLKNCEDLINTWHIQSGDSLRGLLYKWSKVTGWSLVWDSKYDYKISSSADIHDNFISALEALVKSIGVINPPIYIDVYEENKVIRVNNSIEK
ncbi:toxin co-regulated pilus biosynthesis Q family protein [Serratia sp. UGAL515B_01]|nr:toxin co-regulated pilus biosynthesis Q family protein [Serratia sp. UGAL515B_01]